MIDDMQVCAVLQGGAFAAEAVIKEGGVIKLPKDIDLVSAAGLPVAFGTAHLALKERCQVKPGAHSSLLHVGLGASVICNPLTLLRWI